MKDDIKFCLRGTPKLQSQAVIGVKAMMAYLGFEAVDGRYDTPLRVVNALYEMTSGVDVDVPKLFTVFDDHCDEMVILRDIDFTSVCEHHLLPFIGVAHVAYIPDQKVVGVSKLSRLVDAYARRLQVQERLTVQITTALMDYLKPKGAACIIEAKHLCMACRGVRKSGATMITSDLKGAFHDDPATRSEFMHLSIRG